MRRRYLKGTANQHDWDLAVKVAAQIANGGDPVRLISRVLAKARTFGQVGILECLGMPTSHLFDELEDEDPRDQI